MRTGRGCNFNSRMPENLSTRRVKRSKHWQSLPGYERAPSTGLYEGPFAYVHAADCHIPISSSGFLLQRLETSQVFIPISAFRWSLYQQQTAVSELSSLAA